MKSIFLTGALAFAGFFAGLLAAAEPPAGFSALFNGRDLTGWRGGATFDPRRLHALSETERAQKLAEWTRSLTEKNPQTGLPHWHVEQGELVNDGFGGYATTEKDYGDFELLLEYRTVPHTDSGVYLRGIPQVQIWDPARPDPNHNGNARGSGGLWNNAEGSPGKYPLVLADRPIGEWNRLRILMAGVRVSVWLNDRLVVDRAALENYFDRKRPAADRRPIPESGPIQLQTHGGEIRWRHLFLREIGSAEAARLSADPGRKIPPEDPSP
jgi:hypothetical protein